MKQCGLFINTFLKKFSKETKLYADLSLLFGYYWQYMTEVRLHSNYMLYIGVSFVQCLPYLSMYKSFFINELLKKHYSISDIVFYFKSKNDKKIEKIETCKGNIKEGKHQKIVLSSLEEVAIKKRMQRLGLDERYSLLFYKLYLVAKNNE